VSIFRSTFAANTNNGLLAVSASIAADISVIDSIVSQNGNNGLATSGASAFIQMTRAGIFYSNNGINVSGGGTVAGTTPGTNANFGSTTPGAPNGAALPLQ
jgi:hypothetical protein